MALISLPVCLGLHGFKQISTGVVIFVLEKNFCILQINLSQDVQWNLFLTWIHFCLINDQHNHFLSKVLVWLQVETETYFPRTSTKKLRCSDLKCFHLSVCVCVLHVHVVFCPSMCVHVFLFCARMYVCLSCSSLGRQRAGSLIVNLDRLESERQFKDHRPTGNNQHWDHCVHVCVCARVCVMDRECV